MNVPPYSGALIISPVDGSITISRSVAAPASSPAGLANVTVAASASASDSTMSFGVIAYSSSVSGSGWIPVPVFVVYWPETPAVSHGAGGCPGAWG